MHRVRAHPASVSELQPVKWYYPGRSADVNGYAVPSKTPAIQRSITSAIGAQPPFGPQRKARP